MSFVALHVRRAVAALVILAPLGISDAQVALQVKSGTTWTSSIELRALGPVTLRWRWDGAATPTGIAWQVATVPPASMAGTVATRSGDLVAAETPMRLPAATGVKGGYQEFTVDPVATWPPKFYIRMRVNAGRQSVYSRWIAVSVVQRTSVVANPECRIEGTKSQVTIIGLKKTEPIQPGEKFGPGWNRQRLRVLFRNRLTTPVSYRRIVALSANGEPWNMSLLGVDPQKVYELPAAKTDTFHINLSTDGLVFVVPYGVVQVDATANPVSGISSTCSFQYEILK